MKVVQIVIKGNSVSEEYAALSQYSFEHALSEGYIDSIEKFDAITPDSEDFQEHVDRYTWSRSLMTLDNKKFGQPKDDHSPTEKAGMCSHWEIMRQCAESGERVWVIEHDTWMLEERFESFKSLVALAPHTLYANIGLFMGMYSLDPRFCHWAYHMLTTNDFPINCGPYCVLQRLFRTYTTNHLSHPDIDYYGKHVTALHPWHNCDTIGVGRDIGIFFNTNDSKDRTHGLPTPTTQVVSKRLAVTQEHHSYKQQLQDEPWKRHKFFKVID